MSSLEDIYAKIQQLDRRNSYLETLESGTGASVFGFERTVDRAITIGADASVVIDKYLTVEAGGKITVRVGGSIKVLADPPNFYRPYVRVLTTAGAIVATDKFIHFNSASAMAITLPAVAAVSGYTFQATNIGAGTVTISGNANINGSASQTMVQWVSLDFYSNGSIWIAR